MPAYDYSAVADIYDAFCVFDGDKAFFRKIAASAGGPVLELMAGTGRVSMPMLEAVAELTCVDSSPAMLSVLAGKLRGGDLRARVVCADVCHLPFTATFQVAVLPFQGFTELVGEAAQRGILSEVARVLPAGGRFICTSHNPAIREKTIDGRWHEIGKFSDRAGRTLVVHLESDYSDRPNVVRATQRIEILDQRGRLVETRVIGLEFSLVSAQTIVDMAAAVGLTTTRLLGDYQGAPYDEKSSPCVVAVLEKIA
jgi:ubiquinone/menaquinone biosynthesis C-methylase UbiE